MLIEFITEKRRKKHKKKRIRKPGNQEKTKQEHRKNGDAAGFFFSWFPGFLIQISFFAFFVPFCGLNHHAVRFYFLVMHMNRILIAEDHRVSRHLLERNLSNWGFAVCSAGDGEEALALLESTSPPALAIIDWMMPKCDGLEVIRRVRALKGRPYTYFLLLTARSRKEEIAAGLAAGADDYVVKPFEPDELRVRLKVGQRVVRLERELEKARAQH